MWFAYKLVSLNYWIQLSLNYNYLIYVVICLQISIFELLNTTARRSAKDACLLWFAYKLVSLNYWIQPAKAYLRGKIVVICLQISIFELLNTTLRSFETSEGLLWFAYKLVSLNYWIQPPRNRISKGFQLWFAYKLVSLNYWIQLPDKYELVAYGCDLLTN